MLLQRILERFIKGRSIYSDVDADNLPRQPRKLGLGSWAGFIGCVNGLGSRVCVTLFQKLACTKSSIEELRGQLWIKWNNMQLSSVIIIPKIFDLMAEVRS